MTGNVTKMLIAAVVGLDTRASCANDRAAAHEALVCRSARRVDVVRLLQGGRGAHQRAAVRTLRLVRWRMRWRRGRRRSTRIARRRRGRWRRVDLVELVRMDANGRSVDKIHALAVGATEVARPTHSVLVSDVRKAGAPTAVPVVDLARLAALTGSRQLQTVLWLRHVRDCVAASDVVRLRVERKVLTAVKVGQADVALGLVVGVDGHCPARFVARVPHVFLVPLYLLATRLAVGAARRHSVPDVQVALRLAAVAGRVVVQAAVKHLHVGRDVRAAGVVHIDLVQRRTDLSWAALGEPRVHRVRRSALCVRRALRRCRGGQWQRRERRRSRRHLGWRRRNRRAWRWPWFLSDRKRRRRWRRQRRRRRRQRRRRWAVAARKHGTRCRRRTAGTERQPICDAPLMRRAGWVVDAAHRRRRRWRTVGDAAVHHEAEFRRAAGLLAREAVRSLQAQWVRTAQLELSGSRRRRRRRVRRRRRRRVWHLWVARTRRRRRRVRSHPRRNRRRSRRY